MNRKMIFTAVALALVSGLASAGRGTNMIPGDMPGRAPAEVNGPFLVTQEVSGTVESVNAAALTVRIVDVAGRSREYTLSGNTLIRVREKRTPLSQVGVGDHVTLTPVSYGGGNANQ